MRNHRNDSYRTKRFSSLGRSGVDEMLDRKALELQSLQLKARHVLQRVLLYFRAFAYPDNAISCFAYRAISICTRPRETGLSPACTCALIDPLSH